MKRLLTIFCVTSILFFSDIKAVEEFRSWTNKDGNSIEAKFIKFKEEQIEIRRRDGFTFTLDPSTLSQDDQDYLAELEKHKDSAGRVWHKGSYQQELVRQKWFDSYKDDRTVNFYDFEQGKIDINGDKVEDGFRVRIFSKTSKTEFDDKAWEIDDNGTVTLKSANSHTMYKGKYKYNFEEKSFKKIEGYGPNFFISAE